MQRPEAFLDRIRPGLSESDVNARLTALIWKFFVFGKDFAQNMLLGEEPPTSWADLGEHNRLRYSMPLLGEAIEMMDLTRNKTLTVIDCAAGCGDVAAALAYLPEMFRRKIGRVILNEFDPFMRADLEKYWPVTVPKRFRDEVEIVITGHAWGSRELGKVFHEEKGPRLFTRLGNSGGYEGGNLLLEQIAWHLFKGDAFLEDCRIYNTQAARNIGGQSPENGASTISPLYPSDVVSVVISDLLNAASGQPLSTWERGCLADHLTQKGTLSDLTDQSGVPRAAIVYNHQTDLSRLDLSALHRMERDFGALLPFHADGKASDVCNGKIQTGVRMNLRGASDAADLLQQLFRIEGVCNDMKSNETTGARFEALEHDPGAAMATYFLRVREETSTGKTVRKALHQLGVLSANPFSRLST